MVASEVPSSPANSFYQRLDRALEASGFGDAVRELHESTPDPSSFSAIRQRLGSEVFEQVFEVILKALPDHDLLRAEQWAARGSDAVFNLDILFVTGMLTRQALESRLKLFATG